MRRIHQMGRIQVICILLQKIKYLLIQIFGIDANGKTYSIFINEFQPFFFVKVGDHWTQSYARQFFEHLKNKMGFQKDGLLSYRLIGEEKHYMDLTIISYTDSYV